MSNLFDCPCPRCGQRMEVRQDGDVECAACEQRYHARLGYLLPLPRTESAGPDRAKVGLTTSEPR